MSDPIDNLLPEGLADRLPREAAITTRTMRAVLDTMHSHGYDRVSPPLIEFERSLAGRMANSGETDGARGMFRFVDPVSLRLLALRSDMTVQLGRITATSLADAPRPLRLCYAGEIATISADQLAPMRQRLQMGAELIGSDTVAAASEMVALAVESLEAAGASGLSVDFTMPDLVDILAKEALPLPADRIEQVRRELDTKDAGGLKVAGGGAYLPFLFATGPFDDAMRRLVDIAAGLSGDNPLQSRIDGLAAIAERISGSVRLTLDPTERHGFGYQSWFGFTVYADGVRGAVGRGGTYAVGGTEECATGFSIYCDTLIEGLSAPEALPMVYCRTGYDRAKAAELRAQGYRTIAPLVSGEDAAALGCSHVLAGVDLTPLTN